MKRMKTLCLFFFFVITLVVGGALHADNEIYGSCGGKPSTLDKLFTNAAKIREKCIEDIYEANKEKTRKEIEELANTIDQLNAEIKKVAIKSSVGLVQCEPRYGEAARDKKLIKRCQDAVAAQNALIDRMDTLAGWKEKPRPKSDVKNVEDALNAPCPPDHKLSDLRVAATYNRKLFKMWEHCRNLMIDKM